MGGSPSLASTSTAAPDLRIAWLGRTGSGVVGIGLARRARVRLGPVWLGAAGQGAPDVAVGATITQAVGSRTSQQTWLGSGSAGLAMDRQGAVGQGAARQA